VPHEGRVVQCRPAALLILLACLTACARRDIPRTIPQIAILRFENLSADATLDWMGRGFAEILSGELQGSSQRYAIQYRALHAFDASLGRRDLGAPGISAETTGALVAGANQIVFGDFSVADGILRATATEEELATQKMVRVASASGPSSHGIFPVAEALARQLGGTRPFATRNPQALRELAAALESPDPVAASQDFAQASAADPDFGRAYVLWLETAIAQRNRSEADRVVALARAHRDRFSALDMPALDLDAAALRGDFHAELAARRQLACVDPANPDYHRALAEALMGMRDNDGAIVEFRRGLSIRPDDAVALNTMGYAAAYSGDLPTAIRVLRGYEQLRPREPNPLDSLGDAHFALGHFREAEQFYLAAHTRAPGFLNGGEALKAAQARLMTGDIAGATALFKRYLAGREAVHDPNAPYHAAAWSWQTGARREAVAAMDRLAQALAQAGAAGPLRELASRADAQSAVWLLNLGDRAGAAEHARKAVAEAGPATSALVSLVAYLAQPDAQPEAFPPPAQSPLKDYAQAYALLFDKKFRSAAQVLQELYMRPTPDPDDGLAVLLAWAYEESGDWQRAEPLLRLNPLPQAAGLPMFSSLYFPRLFFLRGAALEHAGHRPEAVRYYQLFHKLGGS
jgi:tetratricopeptide (TPR) repeat protein